MGIKGLTKLLAVTAPKCMTEMKFESYFGRKIAIDARMGIYQILNVVGQIGTETPTNEAGEGTSHLQGMMSHTIRLLEAGMKPVYSKRAKNFRVAIELLSPTRDNIEDIEKFTERTVKVTRKHYDDCKKLLRLMGMPVVEAPSEAEAQCVALCKSGKVYAVASEDMDTLTFGTPRFLRHLMDPSSGEVPVMEFEMTKVLEDLDLTMDQFIDMCILSGCDYCDSITGICGKTALKLIRQHGSMETLLENINRERYPIPEDWPYQEARRMFKEPFVYTEDEEPEINWSSPDEEGLVNFLVNDNGFDFDEILEAMDKMEAAKNKLQQGG